MLGETMNDFFLATAGASASFIGLLFVAISFIDDRLQGDRESLNRILAESSYIALLNVFFISLVGLVPQTNLGFVILIMGLSGGYDVIRFIRVVRRTDNVTTRTRRAFILSSAVYAGEVIYGLALVIDLHTTVSPYPTMALMIFLFSVALSRAWELTGIRNRVNP